MIKRALVLALFLALIPSTPAFAATTSLNISLSDAGGQPLSNVRISMDLYFYEVLSLDQKELRGAYSDECRTNAQGECTIQIGETQDLLLHGRLDLGEYGSRDVEWHGGALNLPIQIMPESKTQLNLMKTYGAILFAFIALGVILQYRKKGK